LKQEAQSNGFVASQLNSEDTVQLPKTKAAPARP